MLKRILNALMATTLVALPGFDTHAFSWDFMQRLSEPGKVWHLNCEQPQKSAPFIKDADLQFYYDSISLSLWIDGKKVQLDDVVRSGMKRLREKPSKLACTTPHSAFEPAFKELETDLTHKLDCEGSLRRSPSGLAVFEHVSAIYHDGGNAKCVYFFLFVPDDSDLRRDELMIKTVWNQGGVGENSVHGGPPN